MGQKYQWRAYVPRYTIYLEILFTLNNSIKPTLASRHGLRNNYYAILPAKTDEISDSLHLANDRRTTR